MIPHLTGGGCRDLPVTYGKTATISDDDRRKVWARYNALFSSCLRLSSDNLHYLNLHGVDITREDLLTIATMPNLQHLWIQPMASWSLNESLPVPALPFPKLESLQTQIDDSDNIKSCDTFLARLRPPRLECLFLFEYVGVGSSQELRDLWATVSAMAVSQTLRCLVLHFRLDAFSDRIRFSDLKPLLSLSNLGCLCIILAGAALGAVEFKDQDFVAVADAWPKLGEFQLLVETGASRDEGPNVLPTMNALVTLAKHPMLWKIGLTFDTSVAVDLPDPNWNVKELCVDGSILRTDAIPAVAEFLSGLFPNVSRVESDRYFGGEDAWDDFHGKFDEFHAEYVESDSGEDEEEETDAEELREDESGEDSDNEGGDNESIDTGKNSNSGSDTSGIL